MPESVMALVTSRSPVWSSGRSLSRFNVSSKKPCPSSTSSGPSVALACWIAARSVHAPVPSLHTSSPRLESVPSVSTVTWKFTAGTGLATHRLGANSTLRMAPPFGSRSYRLLRRRLPRVWALHDHLHAPSRRQPVADVERIHQRDLIEPLDVAAARERVLEAFAGQREQHVQPP